MVTMATAQEAPRGLFVTAYGDPSIYISRLEISKLIAFAKKSRTRILFVQIYRANKAWFPSEVGDSSVYDKAVKAVGDDPLALLIKQAHQEGIEVHAWLNLLSFGDNPDARLLKKYGPDILTRNTKEKKVITDYKIDGQYFLEPGDLRVRQELSRLVGEILKAYPTIDGLQFDYIRYPDSDPHYGYTSMNVERFKKATGFTEVRDASKPWQQWKRDQVTELVKELVQKARSIRPDVQVSVTGCMPYARAMDEAFQDWPKWVNEGIADFVTIMNYSLAPKEFDRWNAQIKTKVKDFSKVDIAIGAYKKDTTLDIFRQEFNACEDSGAGACVAFYYSSLVQMPALRQFMTDDQ